MKPLIRPRLTLFLVVSVWHASVAQQHAAPSGPPFEPRPLPAHPWEYIRFPRLPLANSDDTFEVLLSSGVQHGQSRLQFAILLSSAEVPRALEKQGSLEATLHVADRSEVAGKVLSDWVSTGTWSYAFTFPWAENDLDEGWIELDLAGSDYWFEIPYGFVRDPNSPEVESRREAPEFPSRVGIRHTIVPWLFVTYPSIDIQNGWKLNLHVRNSFDAEVEAVLYRDDRSLWSLHDPRLAMSIVRGQQTYELREIELRLHDDRFRRSDIFELSRRLGGTRGWGQLVVTVDDATYTWRIPSSLFLYTHGNADWGRVLKYLRPQP